VGCGAHARSSHGPAQRLLAERRPDVVRAACSDVDAGRAEEHRRLFGFARSYADTEAMLDAERPDAIVLVVSEAAACDLASAVLRRGLPLLLEKPPGRNLEELDRMRAAASHGAGRGPVPHQVAFNRRFVPLVGELRRAIAEAAAPVQHVHYEMTRVDRRDPDFSATAIHGIDTVRFLAGADYAHVRFRYQEKPELGPGVANVFLDALMTSGATAHLAFCPVAGVVVERATVHAGDHTFFLRVPMWGAYDSPGRLEHVRSGRPVRDGGGDPEALPFELGGFYAEYEAFFDSLAAGRHPAPSLDEARQSVAVAECLRRRESEYRA
jgi:predicted dehydrogenase